jgi:predicted MPP superfamily phosphohydrolase
MLLACFLAGWAFWWEPASLSTERHDLSLPNWPSACSGLRVAVLADLHTGSPYNGLDKLEQIVSLTNAAEPDVVLLAGDFVIHGVLGGEFVEPRALAAVLAGLDAPGGVYAVMGNHDIRYGAGKVTAALQAVAIDVLENRSLSVESDSCEFRVAGVSDFKRGPYDVDKALSGIVANSPVIVFTHNPDLFPLVPDWVALTVAGHTHGGQVYFPGLGRPVMPSDYGSRYALGHIQEQGRHLFVNTGTGTSILPARFFVPPVVSVLTLLSAESVVAD